MCGEPKRFGHWQLKLAVLFYLLLWRMASILHSSLQPWKNMTLKEPEDGEESLMPVTLSKCLDYRSQTASYSNGRDLDSIAESRWAEQ